jgi:hypothetical protein
VTGYPRSGNSLTAAQILTATLTFAVTCGRSCVPLAVEPEISPLEYPGRTFPSASMPASGPRHVRGPLPSPIRPSKRPLSIHSTRCATHSGLITGIWHSSTPLAGQLPDRPVGPGRRDEDGIRPTARPRPIAVADSPIEAATPDPQHPMSPCYLSRSEKQIWMVCTMGQMPVYPYRAR